MAKSKSGFSKVVNRVARKVKGRYFKGKGYSNPKMKQIMKDVTYLKSVLNPEKKSFSFSSTDTYVGQCNVNADGYYVRDITPIPSQSDLSTGRNGNSIRVHSTHFKFQLQQMASSSGNAIRFKIMLCKVIGAPIAEAQIPGLMYKQNTFVLNAGVPAIIDYNSDRREDTFKRFIILRQKNVSLAPSQHNSNYSIYTGSMGLKYKSHHVKFTSDGSQSVSDGQLFLLVLADNGNTSQTTNSTLSGTQTIAFATGANLQTDITHWYYDN